MIRVLNVFQVLFLLVFTGICGIVGSLIMLITRNTDWVLRYIPALWHRVVFAVCLARVRVYGRENIPKEGYHIYTSNHESSLDIAAVVRAVPLPLYFIVKKELRKVPVLGIYIRLADMIFVDRGNRDAALKSMQNAARLIKGGKNVIVFPEGTRSKTGELLQFRKGSFKIACDGNIGVVPIAIVGTREVNPSGSFKLNPGTVKVQIGQPIYPHDHPEFNAEKLADFTRQRVDEMRRELRSKSKEN